MSVLRLPLIALALAAVWWWLFRIAKRRSLRITLVAAGVLLALSLTLLFAQWGYELRMQSRASRLAAQIESYHTSRGKYPVSLLDVGVREVNGPIHYERDLNNPSVYSLWFGTGFGTVSEYDSKTRSWHGPQ